MGFYESQVLPRVIDKMLANKKMAKVRSRSLEGLHGTVLEIGFGSGPNLPLLPPDVERVLAVDPAVTGRKLAAKRVAASKAAVDYIGLDGQSLPLDDESVDCALSTWTLCTIPDVGAALAEVARVLKPGGELFFLEHGLSSDARVAERQHKWNHLQNKVAGGCNLDRDIEAIIDDAGFHIQRLARFNIAGPRIMSSMYAGVATRP